MSWVWRLPPFVAASCGSVGASLLLASVPSIAWRVEAKVPSRRYPASLLISLTRVCRRALDSLTEPAAHAACSMLPLPT